MAFERKENRTQAKKKGFCVILRHSSIPFRVVFERVKQAQFWGNGVKKTICINLLLLYLYCISDSLRTVSLH